MQVTIEIEPTTFSLLQKVKEKGVSLDVVLREALSRFEKEQPLQQQVSAEDRITSLKNWATKKRNLPEITDEMLSLENIYEDRI